MCLTTWTSIIPPIPIAREAGITEHQIVQCQVKRGKAAVQVDSPIRLMTLGFEGAFVSTS